MSLFDSASTQKPAFFISTPTKGRSELLFEIKDKNRNVVRSVKQIDGNITGIKYTENTNKDGEVIKGFRVTIDTSDGVGLLSVGFSNLGRGIMNLLLSLQHGRNVTLELYRKKGAEGSRPFDNCSISQDWEKVRWAHKKEEIPAKVDMGIMNGKNVYSFDNMNQFFIDKMNEKFSNFSFETQSAAYVPGANAPEVSADDAVIEGDHTLEVEDDEEGSPFNQNVPA